MAACSGEDGQPGEDGVSPDNIPPTVALLTPASGDTVRDTLRVVANAIDNIAVERVVFYFDGDDVINDSTFAEDTLAPYEWTFDLIELGVDDGPHTVMARAFDVDRNQSDTPPVIVHTVRQVPAGLAVLRAWEPDSTGWYTFPERDIQGEDTLSVDTLHNVRFVPERQAVIDSIRFYVSGNIDPELLYDSPLRVGVFRSDGVYPVGDTLATALVTVVPPDTVSSDTTETDTTHVIEFPAFDGPRWVSVSGFDLLEPFDEGERFHVAVWADEPTERTMIALGVSLQARNPYPTQNASSRFYEVGTPTWQSLQTQFPGSQQLTREFMIEVWVTYQ